MKAILGLFLVLGVTSTAFAQATTIPVVSCSNEGTDVDVNLVVDAAAAVAYYDLAVTTSEGTPVSYVIDQQTAIADLTTGQEVFITPAIDPTKVVESHGVIAEGIMIEVFGTSAILAKNGFIEVLTCTWPTAATTTPPTAP